VMWRRDAAVRRIGGETLATAQEWVNERRARWRPPRAAQPLPARARLDNVAARREQRRWRQRAPADRAGARRATVRIRE